MQAEIIDQTIAAWTAEPDQARSTPSVTARSENGQAAVTAGPFTWRTDLPTSLGGTNQAPSPTALLLSALAGCAVVLVQDILAPQLGIRVEAIEATARCHADGRGLLGIDGAEPDFADITLEVVVRSPDGESAVAEIARAWEERCPIYLALQKPNDVAVHFQSA